MANPTITPLPQAPNRGMARTVYPVIADTWAAAIGPWTTQVNDVVTWMGQQVTATAASATAAADSATAAAQSASSAATQAGNAKTSADAAKASADSAQVYAAAAGAAAGIPSLAGNAGKALVVDAAEQTVAFQDVGLRPGDYLFSAVNPGASYLPAAAGQTLNQSTYPKLFARIGALVDWSRVLASLPNSNYTPQLPGRNGSTIVAGQQANNFDTGFLRSLDGGGTWSYGTASGMSSGSYVKQVEYFSGKYMALVNGRPDLVGYLVDPTVSQTTWTSYNLPSGANYPTRMAQGGGKLLVAVPKVGVNITTNGTSYSYQAVSLLDGTINDEFYNFKYVDGNFYIMPAWNAAPFGSVLKSQDGLSWSKVTVNTAVGIYDIAGNGQGKLVALASSLNSPSARYGYGCYVSNDNGSTWSGYIAITTGSATIQGGVSYFAPLGLFIVISASGSTRQIITSPDGVNWSAYQAPHGYFNLSGPLILSSSKILFGTTQGGYHYDPSTQFWAPPMTDHTAYIRSYVKVA